jgi:hypothetical protein
MRNKALDVGLSPGQDGRGAYLDQCMGEIAATRALGQETKQRLRRKSESHAVDWRSTSRSPVLR